MTFWDHLDELRGILLKCLLAILLAAVLVFCFKDQVFAVIFAPRHASLLGSFFPSATDIQLINTDLTRQFIVHMQVSAYVGMLLVAPYLLWQLYSFVLPALRQEERRYTTPLLLSSYIMFMLGVCFSYFVLFPLTFRFLGNYQVADNVQNLISLESYIDTLLFLSLAMGITFEFPVLSWFLGRLHILHRRQMRLVRRHAFVAIIIIAAIITPTTDAFTLMLVSLPMYLLYEFSILVVRS